MKISRIGIPHLIIGILLVFVAWIGLQALSSTPQNVNPDTSEYYGDFIPARLGNYNYVFLPMVSKGENVTPAIPDTTTPVVITVGTITYNDPSGSVQCHLTLAYETWTDPNTIVRLNVGTTVTILGEDIAPTIWNGSKDVYLVRLDGQNQTCYLRQELVQVQNIQQ
ncbi:hypothetical protein A2X44_00295 [candidate division CPR3 bacterium GWF2_35_18]|uniref:Uncharacterized protein n=1 Tax=candidate division CPR3 bacterium GW2011_GWF2_35_18 TaxID=1618350 RepID=A0A0G0BKX8_UNCC3|nr:MAG: hypothetical protein UR67_C0001G0043 [candidate division CPR3 bacterium GW2011_GWF2_35_18]OGB63353.1 MAG: hypothetical protein A2X44_00295 [candidate division CPR3 bacterium GWF2_35_18]OGB65579.1 MAG: hypothetical protein A2250_02220 [candidate division CPR3 bacterium RIFOXYA2_FULL_35_13]